MEFENQSLKRQLQTLKKELKGWESMFERKHGHKPTKADIEESPNEIRETYREYKKVKSLFSGEETKEKKATICEDASQLPPQPAHKEGGVFGTSLNKKPKKKDGGQEKEGEWGGERKSVWKVRRWSKNRGHHTVVVNGSGEMDEGEKSEDTDKEMAESSTKDGEERSKSPSRIEHELKEELEQLSQGISFKDLTASPRRRPLSRLLGQEGGEEVDEDSYTIPLASCCLKQPHFNMASNSPTKTHGPPSRRLRHGHTVSQKWLERCKPDLAEFEPEGSHSFGEGAGSSEGEGEGIEEEEEIDEEESVEEELENEVDESLDDEEEEEEEAWLGVVPHHNDNNKDPCRVSPLSDSDVYAAAYDKVKGDTGYSWDDNDEAISDDSCSGDDPVISPRMGGVFETKWEELANSVTTLSPMKQPPLSQQSASTSRSSKKSINLSARITQSSSSTATNGPSSSCGGLEGGVCMADEKRGLADERRGLTHLRDGMTLLELYGSKGHEAATQPTDESIVLRLSNVAESGVSSRSTNRNRDGRRNRWKLMPSASAKNYVHTDTSSSLPQSVDNGSTHSTKVDPLTDGLLQPSTLSKQPDLPSKAQSDFTSQIQADLTSKAQPGLTSQPKSNPPTHPLPGLPSRTQLDSLETCQPPSPTASKELIPPSDHDGLSSSALGLDTLESRAPISADQGGGKSEERNIQSDMALLSQQPPMRHGNLSSVATSGRSLRRGRREKVHSAAAVITEVEQADDERGEGEDKGQGMAGQGRGSCEARDVTQLSKATEVGERISSRQRSSAEMTSSNSKESQAATSLPSSGDSGSSGGRGKGKSVSDNFVRLNMKVKKFSRRPGRSLTGSAYKRQMWKKRQNQEMGGAGGGAKKGPIRRNVCFKCGKPGHWAKNCTDNGGSKNLGKFAGEAVKFDDNVILGQEDDLDTETLEGLAKNSPFPTVHEAAMMATGVKVKQPEKTAASKEGGGGGEEEEGGSGEKAESYVAPPPCHVRSTPPPPSVEPLYPLAEDGGVTNTPQEVFDTLKKFGYTSFRPGQEEAIINILSGVSTLVIHSTGSGKSLCYQLPAYLYADSRAPCITLVISPLVSLMEDQVRHFPAGLKGACLHTNQTRPQREKVLCDAVEGRISVLLLSPEALVGGALWSGRESSYSLRRLPPVAFACIDEVHCVSEWSHNFRPSYLRIHKVLKERLGVHCILGLTATATHTTALSVASHLAIHQHNIIRGTILPDNLHISVSCDRDRDQALVELLQSTKFRDCESIIIYCTRQQQTERVAQLLRTCLQSIPTSRMGMEDEELETPEDSFTGGKRKSRKRKGNASSSRSSKKRKTDWSADSYHAGMAASQRKRVQNDFMNGRVRIVVATVAFGMGLNKSDVRAIIHYNLPKSFESFVQEIGRAGRDGLPAYCHVFIDKEMTDICELRRHAYSNTIDPYTVKQLVRKAFPLCHCRELKQSQTLPSLSDSAHQLSLPTLSSPRWCVGHEVAVAIEDTVQKLDVKEECISTLLCYLELQGWLELVGVVNDSCTLKCYGGARQLRALARKVPAVAAAAARLRERGTDLEHTGEMTFSVIEVANSMGWEAHIVRSEVGGLQYNDRGTGGQGSNGARSTVLVEFSGLSFHLRSIGDFSPEERDHVCEFLSKKVKGQEEREVEKLHLLHAVLHSISQNSYFDCDRGSSEVGSDLEDSTSTLRKMICRYFSSDGLDKDFLAKLDIPVLPVLQEISPDQERHVSSDVHSLVSIHSDHQFTGRTVARIFHGIASPLFPAEVWGRQYRFWRRHVDVDFNLLCQIATKKLLELR